MGANPADFWYQGEIGFFDNCIIPLAKKLKERQVFGVSSEEFLDYAVQNRYEWEQKGQAIVEEMIKTHSQPEDDVAVDEEAETLRSLLQI
jgi:hypothetical protein